METIIILFGCAALVVVGLIWAGFGAMGESIPACFAGLGVAALGIGFAIEKVSTEWFGVELNDTVVHVGAGETVNSFTISAGFTSFFLYGVVGVIGIILLAKYLLNK
jgi:hypothetical protein